MSVVSNKPVLGLLLGEQPLLCCVSPGRWEKLSMVRGAPPRAQTGKRAGIPRPRVRGEVDGAVRACGCQSERDLCSQHPGSPPWPHHARDVSMPGGLHPERSPSQEVPPSQESSPSQEISILGALHPGRSPSLHPGRSLSIPGGLYPRRSLSIPRDLHPWRSPSVPGGPSPSWEVSLIPGFLSHPKISLPSRDFSPIPGFLSHPRISLPSRDASIPPRCSP